MSLAEAMSSHDTSRRRYVVYALAVLAVLIAYADATIIAVAIPAITSSLSTSLGWVAWTLTAYQLVQVVVTPLAGKLSDDLGRKRVFLFCVGCFTVGSLLCGLAPNIGSLIVFRVLQAIGAGGLMPSAFGIVSDHFQERRSQAIGLFGTFVPIGAIAGPLIGGWIVEHWSWREVFFINIPIGILVLIGVQLVLQEKREGRASGSVDLPGLGLFSGAMIAFMLFLTMAGNDFDVLRSPSLWLLAVTSIVLFALFFKQEQRAEQPMVAPELVYRLPFLPANLYIFLSGACSLGSLAFLPYFAMVQYGMNAEQAGALITPRMVALIAVSTVTSIYILRFSYRIPLILGALSASAGLLTLGLGWNQVVIGPLELSGFSVIAVTVAITGAGVGFSSPSSTNAVLDLLPGRAAAITGLRLMFQQTGVIVSTSVIALVLSAYQDKAAGFRTIFIAMAVVLLAPIPLALMIPDSARERRRQRLQRQALSQERASESEVREMSEPVAD